MPEPEEMPPPLSKEERLELDAFKSDMKSELADMSEAAVRHVERIVAPFATLPKRVDQIEQHTKDQAQRLDAIEKNTAQQGSRMETVETHTVNQTIILERLEEDAKKNKKDRIARRAERISRKALDENWRRNRRWIVFAISLVVAAGEMYHNCLSSHGH
jgi:hypothetical protein